MTSRRAVLAIGLAASICFGATAQNQAASFDGSGSGWIEVPDNPSLVPATGLTVEAWVYRSSTNSGGYRSVVRKNSTPFNESYNFRIFNGFPQMGVHTAVNSTDGPTSSTPMPTNSWHHYAGTFDNSTIRLYLDGALIGQQSGFTGPLLNTGSALKIAAGDNEPWSGSLDCIRIWSVARTQQQIQQTMNYQVTGAPNLISSWNMNGNFLDSTGTNHGVAMGSVPLVPGAPLIGFLAAPSASPVGAPLVFQINNQTGALPYIFDVSVTGISPGVTVAPGIVVPLNPPFLNYDSGASLPGLFVNFFGFLDAAGHASPYVNVPPIPALVGTVVSATYVAIDTANPMLIDFVAPPTQTLLSGLAPTIATVAPPTGSTIGGTPVTITGNFFQAGATVSIGSVAATGISVTSPTALSCVAPAGTLGPKSVSVTNPDGFSATLANGFTYVTTLALSQVAPPVAAPGVTIVVTGSGIDPGASVLVGGVPVTPMMVSPTQITFVNPAGVSCDAAVQVTNPNGQTASKPFNPSPQIGSLLSRSGPAAGGNVELILGSSFFLGSTVQVNGNTVTWGLLGNSLIQVTMPPGSPGPAQLTVTSVNGCSASATYTYL